MWYTFDMYDTSRCCVYFCLLIPPVVSRGRECFRLRALSVESSLCHLINEIFRPPDG